MRTSKYSLATESAKRIQAWWRGELQRRHYQKLLKQKNVKRHIAHELLSSEEAYVEDLYFLVSKVQKSAVDIIPADDYRLLFSTIGEIYKFHHGFLEELRSELKQYHHHFTKLSQPVLNLFHQDSFKHHYTEYCVNYEKSDQCIKSLVQNNQNFNQLLKDLGLSNSLQSYLIKPMQRLCKYELLLAKYIKNTTSDHCDYKFLLEVEKIVEKMVKETNDDVGEFLLSEEYRGYLDQYPDIFQQLPNPDRKMLLSISEVSLIDLIKDEKTSFKEMAMFTDSILLIPFQNTRPILLRLHMMRQLPNLKYFKNLVQIISDHKYMTLELKSEQKKEQLLSKTQKADCHEQNISFVDVKMLGTEQRESVFKTYTVYIVEITSENQVVTRYPRFKDLFKVREIVESQVTNLDLPVLQKQGIFGTMKSKTIEKRKLTIQEFLEKILNSKQCYEIKEVWQILDLKEFTKQKMGNKKQANIVINLPNEDIVKIHIDRKSRIKDLKKQIAQSIGLIYSSQFQIFQLRNGTQRRIMYDDALVEEIYQAQKHSFNPFKDTISYIYTRHYYLDLEEQYTLYKNDCVRTELQLAVIRANICEYKLEEELMITFMCLFAMYTNVPINEAEKVKSFIKNIGKKQYKVRIDEFFTYYGEVERMVMVEQEKTVAIPFLIIKSLGNSPLYGCQQFEVSVHAKCFKSVQSYISALEEKMVLGIKKNFLLFLLPETRHIVQSFPMSNIQKTQIYPTAIVLQLPNIGPAVRLNTNQAFQISKLLEIYKSNQ